MAGAADVEPKRRRRGSRLARDFYGSAVAGAARREFAAEFEAASGIEGLDSEITLLRMRLREVIEKHPEDLPLMLRGVDMLVKAVSARYRLSKEAEHNLSDSILNVIKGAGEVFFPEAFDD